MKRLGFYNYIWLMKTCLCGLVGFKKTGSKSRSYWTLRSQGLAVASESRGPRERSCPRGPLTGWQEGGLVLREGTSSISSGLPSPKLSPDLLGEGKGCPLGSIPAQTELEPSGGSPMGLSVYGEDSPNQKSWRPDMKRRPPPLSSRSP